MLFLVAFQIDAVASHVCALLAPQIGKMTYVTAIVFWGCYGLVAALAVGVFGAWLEQPPSILAEPRLLTPHRPLLNC
jgi:hypothetical protein